MFKRKLDQTGSILPVVGLGILSVILIGLSIYLFLRLDQAENKRDQFAAEAVDEAKIQQEKELEADFAKREKEPNFTFEGSNILGDIKFKYPKTWSGVLEEDLEGSIQIDAYFHPGVVRTDAEDTRSYALRLQLLDEQYSEVLQDFDSLIEDGEVKARGVTFNGTEGVRLDGQLEEVDRGSMVVLPLRDKTIKIWTESQQFLDDYQRILSTFTFNP